MAPVGKNGPPPAFPTETEKCLKGGNSATPRLFKITDEGISLVVQWLKICLPNAGGVCLIPGWGVKISHASWPKTKI